MRTRFFHKLPDPLQVQFATAFNLVYMVLLEVGQIGLLKRLEDVRAKHHVRDAAGDQSNMR